MPLTILTQVEHVPINPNNQPLVYQKDPLEIGTILSTSLYAASTPSNKMHSDDQAIVGTSKDGYPFLLCIDGFHGCQSEKVFEFIKHEVLPLIETYQLQLQKGLLPEDVIPAWQRAIFEAKQAYLNLGVDFVMGAVVTFSYKNITYATGWSIGDIGMLHKPVQGKMNNLLPITQINGFKDGFDDAICKDLSLQKEVIKRSGWFCQPVEVGDEIVAYTYVPEDLILCDQSITLVDKTQLTLAKLDITQCDSTIPNAIDQLWQTIQKTHNIALQQIKMQTIYRLGDDCTLCQFRFPNADLRQTLKRKQQIQAWEAELPCLLQQPPNSNPLLKSSSTDLIGVRPWVAFLKPPENSPVSQVVHKLPNISSLAEIKKTAEDGQLIRSQVNSNATTVLSLDIVSNCEQGSLIQKFFDTKQKLENEEPSEDLLAHYSKKLKQAIADNLFEEQIIYLEQLSFLYAQSENWTTGITLLNCALAILQKHLNHPPFEYYLLAQMERIEALFLESRGFQIPSQRRGFISRYRAELKEIRSKYIIQFQEQTLVWDIVQSLTDAYKNFLGTLIADSQSLLGAPPVQWACVGMGSMARGEMCFYSDLEFAFLIDMKTEVGLEYFRTLTKLLELTIISLGETRFPLFGDQGSPTIGGFSMDTGGNTPLGKAGLYELIDTPQGLAQFQSERWMEDDIIVTNALSTVCHVAGNQKLVDLYNKAKKIQHKKTDGVFSFTGVPFCKKFALKLLRGHLDEFKPDLSQKKEDVKAFGIKKELYRPFQEIANCLALFYNLKATSTLGRINELVKKGVFSPTGATNLKNAVSKVLSLRVNSHIFYQEEKEILCHRDEIKPNEPGLLYLDEQFIASIREIYMVLIPFCESLKRFYMTKSKQTLKTLIFYDPSIEKAKNFGYTADFSKSEIAYHQALALDPNNVKALIKLSRIATEFGDVNKGLMRAQKALKLALEIYEEDHKIVAASHRATADAFSQFGQYNEALDHYRQALSIYSKIYGEQHNKVAACYYDIAGCLIKIGKKQEALKYYEEALAIYDAEDCNAMVCYNGIGSVMESMGMDNTAWEYHQKALIIANKFRWKTMNFLVPKSYGYIGDFLYNHGQYDEALKYFQAALGSDLQLLNSQNAHPRIAHRYHSIGDALEKLKKYEEALIHQQMALQILIKIYGEEACEVTLSYNVIGCCLAYMGRYEEALEIQQKALNIFLKIYDEKNPNLSIAYSNLGHYYEKLGKYKESIEYCQKALNIDVQVYGEGHPRVINMLDYMTKVKSLKILSDKTNNDITTNQ